MNHTGAGNQDGVSGVNDLSYDEANGTLNMYVICQLDMTPENECLNISNMNPDGARNLSNEYLTWNVQGGNGWYFEAWLENKQFAPNSARHKSFYVHFVNPFWGNREGQSGNYAPINASTHSGDYDQEYHCAQMQLSCDVGLSDCDPNPCSGRGSFRFYPNKVVATELAVADLYTWDVWLAVDCLIWTNPVDPDGTPYTQPSGHPVHP